MTENRDKRKVVVTGANGFTGRAVLRNLLKREDSDTLEIVALLRDNWSELPEDLKDSEKIRVAYYSESLDNLRNELRDADALIHLAAYFTGSNSPEAARAIVASNILYSLELLTVLDEANPNCRVVAASTFSAYDCSSKYSPSNVYSASKKAVEDLARGLSNLEEVIFLTLADSYGKDDTRTKVHNLLKGSLLGGKQGFEFRSQSSQVMNLSYVGDVADAFIYAALDLPKEELTEQVETYELYYPENLVTLEDLSKYLLKGASKKGISTEEFKVSFNEDASSVDLPKQRYKLPGWSPSKRPEFIAEELFKSL